MSLALRAATLLVSFSLGCPLAAARVAPDPLPNWEDLPLVTGAVLYSVQDEIGKRWIIDGTEYFTWDIALTKKYAGSNQGAVAFMRLELQGEDGSFLEQTAYTEEELPPDWKEVTLLWQVNGELIGFTDPDGRRDLAYPEQLDGNVSGGSITNLPGIDRGGCKASVGITQCNDAFETCGSPIFLQWCQGIPPFCGCTATGPSGGCTGTRDLICEQTQDCTTSCNAACRCDS